MVSLQVVIVGSLPDLKNRNAVRPYAFKSGSLLLSIDGPGCPISPQRDIFCPLQ
jgi:hypothetical protein